MNSRQINFFLTALDQDALLADLGRGQDFLIVSPATQGEGPHILESAGIREMGHESLKVYLVRPDDVHSIEFSSIIDRGYKIVDVVRSPVIEFVRCFHMENIIRSGRLYVVTSYYEQGYLRKKNGDFVKWAGAVLAKARRKLIRDQCSSAYFGREALQLKAGGTKPIVL